MDPLDRLERERGGQFRFRLDGEIHELPSPLDLSWGQAAALAAADVFTFAKVLPGGGRTVPLWKVEALQEAWRAHHGLPDADGIKRLLYYVRRYPGAIEADFAHIPGLPPLTELWQTRQWRRILNAIDHLPRNSHFTDAVASDEEHAEQVLRAQKSLRALDEKRASKSFSTFSEEVEALSAVADGIRQVAIAIIASNSPKGAQVPSFDPYPRPEPATAKIRLKIMAEKHEALANQVLARRQQAPQD